MKKASSLLVILAMLAAMLATVSFAAPDVPLNGDGTQASPLLITNEDDFFEFMESFYNEETYKDTYIRLENDIATDYEYPAASSGTPFEGVFDGNGKTITFTNPSFTGFFGEISGAIIKNVTVVGNVNVNDTQYDTIGGIVGKATDNSIISHCVFKGSINNGKAGSNNFAGICGLASNGVTIENCVNYADVNSAGSYTAGILGYFTGNTAEVSDCFNYGDISGDKYIAGIIGNVYNGGLYINHCVNSGNISANLYSCGITNFYAQSTSLNISIMNCINRGSVYASASNGYCAGITGYSVSYAANLKIYNCANLGKISGNFRKGGIMAYWSARGRVSFVMKNCYNGGEVTGSNNGALISYYDGATIDDISGNYYDSSKCATAFASLADIRPTAIAVSGSDVNSTMVTNLNNYISEQGKSSTWLSWTIGYVNSDGVSYIESSRGCTAQLSFESDLVPNDSPNGAASVLSEGSLWIIIVVAVIAIAAVAVMVIVRKKKANTPA